MKWLILMKKFMDNFNKISKESSFVCGHFNIDILKSDKHNPTKVFFDQLFGNHVYSSVSIHAHTVGPPLYHL